MGRCKQPALIKRENICALRLDNSSTGEDHIIVNVVETTEGFTYEVEVCLIERACAESRSQGAAATKGAAVFEGVTRAMDDVRSIMRSIAGVEARRFENRTLKTLRSFRPALQTPDMFIVQVKSSTEEFACAK